MESKPGKLRQSVPIGHDCDGAFFDPGTGDVFASAGAGKLSIIHADKSGNYAVVQEIVTPPGSKTMGLDTVADKAYVPSAKFTGDPAAHPPPSVVDGSTPVLG